jgi:hypothetical protein
MGAVRWGLDGSGMPQNLIACDRDQELLLPPSLREWLPEDHLAWFLLEAVGELDLDAFYGAYRADGWGAAAHDPRMMVALLVYAYKVIAEHAAWHARGIASDGSRRLAGARANIKPYPLAEKPAGKLNVTDPDSRNLKTTRGWVQGYNAQAAVTQGQIVVAAEISIESLDTANLQPMVETANTELKAAGIEEKQGVVLADAGYWKNEAIEALVGQGIQTLIAPDADKRKEPRPGRRGGLYDFTRRVLATDWGAELYLKRQGTVEPVFGQIKSNRGANRCLRRGQSAVRSEWRLLATTHNLLKLHQHQLAAS